MTKIEIAHTRLLDILGGSRETWLLPALLREVNWTLDLDDMMSMATLRRAVALLPSECVVKSDGRITVQARQFAPRLEMIEALKGLPTWCDDLPVLINSHESTLRRVLVLADGMPLFNSLKWAQAGVYEISYGFHGTCVRWINRAS